MFFSFAVCAAALPAVIAFSATEISSWALVIGEPAISASKAAILPARFDVAVSKARRDCFRFSVFALICSLVSSSRFDKSVFAVVTNAALSITACIRASAMSFESSTFTSFALVFFSFAVCAAALPAVIAFSAAEISVCA